MSVTVLSSVHSEADNVTSVVLLSVFMRYCAVVNQLLYFRCSLISRSWNVEISLHFILTFFQCSTSICRAFDGQTEFSRVFNFAILSCQRNSRKFDAREKLFYSITT